MIEGRHLVAKNRTRAPITVGGLNMRDTTLKAKFLYADSGVFRDITMEMLPGSSRDTYQTC